MCGAGQAQLRDDGNPVTIALELALKCRFKSETRYAKFDRKYIRFLTCRSGVGVCAEFWFQSRSKVFDDISIVKNSRSSSRWSSPADSG